MKSNKKEVVLEFKLPDFKKRDIKIDLRKNAIAIRAEKKGEKKVKKKDFFHHEKSLRTFSYVTTLPTINPKKAKITFSKGILKIKAPRK